MALVLNGICQNYRKVIRPCIKGILQNKTYFTYCDELGHPIPNKKPKMCEPKDAVACIKSGDMVYCAGAAATPNDLLKAMVDQANEKCLSDLTVCHMHTEGPALYAQPENSKIFRSRSFFMGGNIRKAVAEGNADNIAVFLHEIPLLFKRKIVVPDVALIHVTPPDRHGFCSLGTSVDCVRAACLNSKIIIAQINKQMPRTFGDAIIHESHIDFAIKIDKPLSLHADKEPSPEEKKIGKLIAENLIVDGATLQMGIGSIPDAVLLALHNHKDLGIHSEMFANGVVDLVNKGCVSNSRKKERAGRIVGSFLVGSQKMFDFVHDNPSIEMLEVDYVNDPKVICTMPNMTAINSCIEIDLTGQVCSDSIGTRFYSGFGGQVDFIRGAGAGLDGKGVPIIALGAKTAKGLSKIVPMLKPGAGVVTSRAHVQYVVTENGIASLLGKTMRQRAYELIQIADPKHRESLEKAAFERLKTMPSPC